MKSLKYIGLSAAFICLAGCIKGQQYDYLRYEEFKSEVTADSGIGKPVTVRVIYDNYTGTEDLHADWGYSVLIEGLEKEILFDVGAKPDVFEYNFSKMDLDAWKIDVLVLSHEHADHIGGMPAFAKMRKGIPVIIPHSFSGSFKKNISNAGFDVILTDEPAKICSHLYTSGEFAGAIPEQALVLFTKQGLVVMTGCSHPGIVDMLKQIKENFQQEVYMVFGGFHLLRKSNTEMNDIISGFKALGIKKCGATHCTGDAQISQIKEAFGTGYFEMGVGNQIVIAP
jgi:7,8-dihydropterin-6-yl-methyl-4-(beta-D-ribofuranosyl)aminobenzene 5'-phosphate synthase